jgi:hypothetical protein
MLPQGKQIFNKLSYGNPTSGDTIFFIQCWLSFSKIWINFSGLQLRRRRQTSGTFQNKIISTSNDIAVYCIAKLKNYRREIFVVMYLHWTNKINHFEIVGKVGITGTVAFP